MSLLRRAVRGGAALAAGQATATALGWLRTLILARLLTPQDFGLVGMATVILGFLGLISDLGLSAALVQRKELTNAHKDAAFWSSLAMGVVLFFVSLAAAPLLGERWQTPALPGGHFKLEAYVAGREFLYANDADRILWRARMAVASLTLALALLVFAAARSLFGSGPAFLALGLLVFEPIVQFDAGHDAAHASRDAFTIDAQLAARREQTPRVDVAVRDEQVDDDFVGPRQALVERDSANPPRKRGSGLA